MVEDKWGVNQRLVFMYDENGAPNTVYYYNGSTSATKYYYVLNLQGDVTEIRSTSNALVAQYNYDAFGNILSIKDANGNNITSSTHIANVNPLRYRGYFYDTETGFYYLNSRYYDPATRRFISADDPEILAVGQEALMNYNLYSYCFNNPVMYKDGNGEFPFFAITAAIGAVAGAVVGGIVAASNGDNVWAGVGIGAAAGGLIGLGAGAAAGTLLAGSVTASSSAVFTGGSMLANTVATGGIGAGTTYIADNVNKAANQISSNVVSTVNNISSKINRAPANPGKPFNELGSAIQYGVDPNTLIPTKNLNSLDPHRMADAVKYAGDQMVYVGRTGIIHDGHHRVAHAIQTGRAIDVYVLPYK